MKALDRAGLLAWLCGTAILVADANLWIALGFIAFGFLALLAAAGSEESARQVKVMTANAIQAMGKRAEDIVEGEKQRRGPTP